MKRILFAAATMLALQSFGQVSPEILPHYMTEAEKAALERLDFAPVVTRGIETPPPFDGLRTMAEWEEIEALTMSWTGFPNILKRIVSASMNECQVIILSEDVQETQTYLEGPSAGGAITDFSNITIIDANFDSIWARDYSGNTVYGSEVDDRIFVDWIYNRPSRPNDNASPQYIAEYIGMDMYCTTQSPADLVNTGGNFMADGFGTAFASALILDENEAGNPYGVSTKSEGEVDQIMSDFMGLDRYIKMTPLPYDIIHHIDMHMKLLDEETLLIGEYPEGVADGPQINANIDYVLANFNSVFGTPYRVLRVPMPPSTGGNWPDDPWPNTASYRTYANAVFVNKTIIIPTYREEYDTTAFRIWEENMPGYNLVGIDCDDSGSNIISLAGAIHCITHSVGVDDPLLISHQPLPDTEDDTNNYLVEAYMNHKDGVSNGALLWKTDLADSYTSASMSPTGEENMWSAEIPAQEFGTKVYYYVEGEASSGKVQVRPIVAPEGYWDFKVTTSVVNISGEAFAAFQPVYPNPACAITCIPLTVKKETQGKLSLRNVMGETVEIIHQGTFPQGESKYFFHAQNLSAGAYFVTFEYQGGVYSQKVMVK
jgi:agmatine deiminase